MIKTNNDLCRLIADQNSFRAFLVSNQLIDEQSMCPNSACVDKINNKLVWRNIKGQAKLWHKCLNRNCKGKYWSARTDIFKLTSSSNLSLGKIISLIWYWASKCTVKYTAKNNDVSESTVCNWFRKNTIRNRIRAFADKRRYVRANLEKAKSDLKEVRMFVVERRDARTLVPIIVRHVKPGICNLYKRYNNSRTH